jgi:hypothetical protein
MHGQPSFADARASGGVAPIPAFRGGTKEPPESTQTGHPIFLRSVEKPVEASADHSMIRLGVGVGGRWVADGADA